MAIVQVFWLLCVLLAIVTATTFWFAGMWWGIGVGVLSVIIAAVLLVLGWYVQQQIDRRFKSYGTDH